jgi:acyl-CoA synthetase (AMP-forming)/AMP-acid ligase II
MFSEYLHDPEVAKRAHDEDGHFPETWLAWIENTTASLEELQSISSNLNVINSSSDVEQVLFVLPYIFEAAVVHIAGEEFGQRVRAAIARLDGEAAEPFFMERHRPGKHLSLHDTSSGPRKRLAGYNMPNLLTSVNRELPKTPSGYVTNNLPGPKYLLQN